MLSKPKWKLLIPPSYGTEPAVGRAIKKSGIARDQLFITTKLWNNSHNPEDVEPALEASLKDLDVEYVDLYLIHWPSPFKAGDVLFPRGSNGKALTGDADYVDVRAMRTFRPCIRLMMSIDVQGNGEGLQKRQGEGNWHFQLLSERVGTPAERNHRGPCRTSN